MDEIGDIKDKIVEEVDYYHDQNEWFDSYDISYRYFYNYKNDRAGNPYIESVYITAVAVFTDLESSMESERVVTFLGYNYLYQEYWEMRATPYAAESDRVSETGALSEDENTVKIEEFFSN